MPDRSGTGHNRPSEPNVLGPHFEQLARSWTPLERRTCFDTKSDELVGPGHLHRLERLRDLLVSRDPRADGGLKLLLFSGDRFNADLAEAVRDRADVELIDPDRLYHGS